MGEKKTAWIVAVGAVVAWFLFVRKPAATVAGGGAAGEPVPPSFVGGGGGGGGVAPVLGYASGDSQNPGSVAVLPPELSNNLAAPPRLPRRPHEVLPTEPRPIQPGESIAILGPPPPPVGWRATPPAAAAPAPKAYTVLDSKPASLPAPSTIRVASDAPVRHGGDAATQVRVQSQLTRDPGSVMTFLSAPPAQPRTAPASAAPNSGTGTPTQGYAEVFGSGGPGLKAPPSRRPETTAPSPEPAPAPAPPPAPAPKSVGAFFGGASPTPVAGGGGSSFVSKVTAPVTAPLKAGKSLLGKVF